MKYNKIIILALTILLFFIFSGCAKERNDVNKVVIAEQYGLAYAPIQVMKNKGFLEELLPKSEIEWVKLSNTMAIREAMLTGELDIGFMSIPPFLIGFDNGMEWKIISGLSKSPLGLVTNDNSINSLKDFEVGDKIALPQPGSIQHLLLSMASEKELGRADALDSFLVSMNHPDGYQALISNTEVTAHFTSPPYLFDELENKENKLVLTGKEAFGGEFTFIIGVCTKEFYSKSKEYKGFNQALDKSIRFMNENENESLKIISQAYDIEENKLRRYFEYEELSYTKNIEGINKFMDFMVENNYLKNGYELAELVWDYKE